MKNERDLTLDLLRGYFLAVIVVNHIQSFPSLFEPLTGAGKMWASAAEGFFFISGLILGQLRGGEAAHGDLAGARRKLWRRALTLYVWNALLTLTFTLLGRLTGYAPYITQGIGRGGALDVVARTLTLRYAYGLADMLPIYAGFLALAPLALLALVHGQTALLLLGSLALWGAGFRPQEPVRLTASFFSEPSWQLVFFTGLALGFHRTRLQSFWSELLRKTQRRIAFVLVAVSLVVVYLSWLDRYAHRLPAEWEAYLDVAFDRTTLGPGRVAVFALWFATLYVVVSRYETTLVRWLGGFLLPLGQNSLYVYIVHSMLVFSLYEHTTHSFWRASLLDAAALATIWWMTTRRVFFTVIPR